MIDGQEPTIFNSFWDLSDFNAQNAYSFSCIKANPAKRKYIKNANMLMNQEEDSLIHIK